MKIEVTPPARPFVRRGVGQALRLGHNGYDWSAAGDGRRWPPRLVGPNWLEWALPVTFPAVAVIFRVLDGLSSAVAAARAANELSLVLICIRH